MSKIGDLARELRDDYPAVDVTAVVFSGDFAGVGCCVIPQERVLAVIDALEGRDALVTALEKIAEGTPDEAPPFRSLPRDAMQDIAREALAKVSQP